MKKLIGLFLGAWALAAVGCAVSSQERITVPLFLEGTAPSAGFQGDGFTIQLRQADVAFGPLYLCPGNSAGELCDTARVEWLETEVVNALAPKRVELGQLSGMSGGVGSWMCDYGIVSLLTSDTPLTTDAAAELGGSIVLSGVAVVDGQAQEIPFRVVLSVESDALSTPGIPVIQSPLGSGFSRDLGEQENGVVVALAPETWLSGLRQEHFFQEEGCSEGAKIACRGTLEETCDESGLVVTTRDCAAENLPCVPNEGCQEELSIKSGSDAYRALILGVTTQGRPELTLLGE